MEITGYNNNNKPCFWLDSIADGKSYLKEKVMTSPKQSILIHCKKFLTALLEMCRACSIL